MAGFFLAIHPLVSVIYFYPWIIYLGAKSVPIAHILHFLVRANSRGTKPERHSLLATRGLGQAR